MRGTIEELQRAARETNEKVDRLSHTVSTKDHVEKQRRAETAELRDAIRQLSQTMTASTAAASATNNYGAHVQVDESHAQRTPQSDYATPLFTAPNTEMKRPVQVPVADDDDDFMKVTPAEIQTHWCAPDLVTDTVASDKVSTNTMPSDVASVARSGIVSDTGASGALSAARAAVDDQDEVEANKEQLISATRKLFQESLEGRGSAHRSETFDTADAKSRLSTRSAPSLEMPLSESDY